MFCRTKSVSDTLISIGGAILSVIRLLITLLLVGMLIFACALPLDFFFFSEDNNVIAVIQEIKPENRYVGPGLESSGRVDGYAFKVDQAPVTDLFAYWPMWENPQKARPGSRVKLTFRSSRFTKNELWKVELLQE
jgi:hypothetical protein